MSQDKMAFFYYEEETFWESCRKINLNFENMVDFSKHKNQTKIFKISNSFYGSLDIIDKIIEFNPDQLIFLDHRLNPASILLALQNRNFLDDSKICHFHVYGHLIERLAWYVNIAAIMKDYKVRYSFSCEQMLELAKSFFPESMHDGFCVLPLPVSKQYQYNPRLKFKLRPEFEGKKVIVYNGRISPEKNVHLLLRSIEALRLQREDFVLIIAGNFDDYYSYTGHSNFYNGYQRIRFFELINEIDQDQNFIQFFPFLNESDIIKLVNTADLCLSFSTMIGEDFGMAIAEAAVNGAKVLASNWGGHSEISKHIPSIKTIEVDKLIDFPFMSQQISRLLNMSYNRKIQSEKAFAALSCENVWQIFDQCLAIHTIQGRLSKLAKTVSLIKENSTIERGSILYEKIFEDIIK